MVYYPQVLIMDITLIPVHKRKTPLILILSLTLLVQTLSTVAAPQFNLQLLSFYHRLSIRVEIR
nr:MAG TPA_asm: hypothetical protein [Caudoviricetes sp.]